MDELDRIIHAFGVQSQKIVAMEEMAELTKEICKDMRGKLNRDGMIEEIADTQIMLWQLREIYDIKPSEIEAMVKKKIKRTIMRINNDSSIKTYWSTTTKEID